MRLRLVLGIAGLAGMAIGLGCSEKQKEAARLEAAMKTGDTVVTGSIEQSQDSITIQPTDSMANYTPGETAEPLTEVPTDSAVIRPGLDTSQIIEAELTQPSPDSANPAQPTAARTEEQVPDAAAIPVEERVKQSRQSTATMDQSVQTIVAGYVVQISSTPDQSEANALAAKFVKYGYHAFVTEAFIDGTTYFRVRIGRYDTMTEAEGALSEMNQKYKVSGFVAQVK